MAYIRTPKKLSNGDWYVEIQFKNKQINPRPAIQHVTLPTRNLAIEAAQAMVERYERKEFNPWTDQFVLEIGEDSRYYPLQEVVAAYLDYKVSRGTWSENSQKIYSDFFTNQFIPKLGANFDVRNLTGEILTKFTNLWGNAYETRETIRRRLITFVKWCQRFAYLPRTKTFEIENHLQKREKLPIYITDDEVNKIKQQVVRLARGTSGPSVLWYLRLIDFCFLTGLRISEALNIRLYNINTTRWEIEFHNKKGRRDEVLPIYNIDYLVRLIRNQIRDLARQGKTRPDQRLFDHRDRHHTSRFFKKLVRKALPPHRHNVHFHSLRHGAGTHMLNNGARLEDVKEWLRHEDSRTTERYAKVIKKELAGTAGKAFQNYGNEKGGTRAG